MDDKFYFESDENLSEDLLSEGAVAGSVKTWATLTSNMSRTSFQMKSKADFNEKLLKNKKEANKPKSDTNLLTTYTPFEAERGLRSPFSSVKICGSPFLVIDENNVDAPTPKFDHKVPMRQSISSLLKEAVRIRKRSRARTHIQKSPKESTPLLVSQNKATNENNRVITMEDVRFGV